MDTQERIMLKMDEERLNDSVPQDTIVKILQTKIKRQALEIGKLQATLMEQEDTIKKLQDIIKKYGEETIKISQLVSFMTREEIKEMKKSSIYNEMEHVKRVYKARLKIKNKDVRLLVTKLNELNRKLEEKEMSNLL